MNRCGIDCYSFFCTDIRPIFQVTVLTLLLGLEIKTRETTQVLLHNGLVHSSTSTDTLTIIVRNTAKYDELEAQTDPPDVRTSTTNPPCS